MALDPLATDIALPGTVRAAALQTRPSRILPWLQCPGADGHTRT